MLLSVDIGNTNITFGVFDKENLIETFRLDSNKDLSQIEYEQLFKTIFKEFNINECVIGSVVEELNSVVKNACDNLFKIDSYLIDSKTNYGMKIKLKNPKEVGVDRIANAYGAKLKYKLPIIVIDIGTAITFDIVSQDGDFLGGVIMPGLNLQLKSLNTNTSKLPKIEIGISEKAIGDCTQNALLSGIIRGTACAIEGLLNQCESELGQKATIVATGGQSSLLSKYITRKFDYSDKNLTLVGLKNLYELNKAKSFVSLIM